MSPAKEKSILRQEIRTCLRNKTPEEFLRESEVIVTRLSAFLSKKFRPDIHIALFSPMSREPDLRSLHSTLPEAKLFYPLCGEGCSLTFHPIDCPHTGLAPGTMGIREPLDCSRPVPASSLDVVLVPGFAFTREGKRLGKGGGYYDRFFQNEGRGLFKIGIAFSCQVVNDIPMEPHDFPVDELITS